MKDGSDGETANYTAAGLALKDLVSSRASPSSRLLSEG